MKRKMKQKSRIMKMRKKKMLRLLTKVMKMEKEI